MKEKCTICQNLFHKKALEIHHIIEQSYFRKNNLKVDNKERNLVVLCGSCHNLVSAGEIITERKVRTSQGMDLMWKYKDEKNWNFTSCENIIK